MTDTPKGFDLLDGTPTWEALSPEQQFAYMTRDPEFQRQALNGDAVANLLFDHMTRRITEHRQAEQARELAEAQKAHDEWAKNPDAPLATPGQEAQAELAKLKNDPAFRSRYDAGDLAAIREFDEATRKVASNPQPQKPRC